MKKNPTLTKNMPDVKFNEIPPLKGPDPQGIKHLYDSQKDLKLSLLFQGKKFNLIFLYFLLSQVLLGVCLLLYLL